jgi:hypothetical protein
MPYDAPAPATLKARYPAFTAVDDATIQYWLTDAERFVDTSWMEGDYAPALMAMAAHSMTEQGVAGIASGGAGVPVGVTSFKSASVSLNFSDAAVTQQVEGGLQADRYGREYQDLLARNKAGGSITLGGVVPCCDGYNGYAGVLPPFVGYQ